MGHVYRYEYDAAGDLAVHLPDTRSQYVTLLHHSCLAHFFHSGTDPRGNTVATTTYYPDGRLETVTDALNKTTRYTYDLVTNTTTITNPDGGTVDLTYDNAVGGKVVAERVMISLNPPTYRTTEYGYDDTTYDLLTERLDTSGLNLTASYTYSENGHRTSITNPMNVRVIEATYNPYGGPLTITGQPSWLRMHPAIWSLRAVISRWDMIPTRLCRATSLTQWATSAGTHGTVMATR
jgi:YD repeat-containing protein